MYFNLGMMNPVGLSGIPAVIAAQLKTYNYEPTWISNFSLPTQDADGWSILTPSADSRVMYVSSAGNDGTATIYAHDSFADTYNPSGENAYLTIAAAVANMRDGYPDYVLLNKGDTFTPAAKLDIPSGRSATERAVLGAYGSGGRPFIDRAGDSVSIEDYTAVIGLEISDTTRIPSHGNFVGFNSIDDGRGVYCFGGAVEARLGNLVEGCYIHHKGIGISHVGDDFSDIVIRKNLIANTFKNNGGRHPQGIWGEDGSYLVEENVFAACGFYDDETQWAAYSFLEPTVFSHSTYFGRAFETIFRNNFSFRPSSIHFKFTSSYNGDLLDTALTGASETSVSMDAPINPLTPSSGVLEVLLDNNTPLAINYTSYTGSDYTIESTDFSVNNASVGQRVVANWVYSHDMAVYNNSMVEGEVAISMGGNEKDPTDGNFINSDAQQRWQNCHIQGNVLSMMNNTQPGGRSLAWGVELVDNHTTVVTENLATQVDNPAVDNKFMVDIEGYANSIDVYNNISHGMDNIEVLDGGDNYSNASALSDSDFVDETVSPLTYQSGTLEDLKASLLVKTIANWDDSHTATLFNAYMREGFAIAEDIVAFEQPLGGNFSDSEAVSARFDAVGNTRLTFQWYNAGDDSVISGQTSRDFNDTLYTADDGLQVYCIAMDEGGNTLQSSTVTFTLSPPVLLFDGVDGYAEFDEIASGYGVHYTLSFKFKGTTAVDYIMSRDGSSNSIDITDTSITLQSRTFTFAAGILDGTEKLIVIDRQANGDFTASVDGVDSGQTENRIHNHRYNTIAEEGGVARGPFSLYELEFNVDDTVTKYDMYSGSTTTESASVGSGTMTFHNVVSGDWV